ncbi:MAG: hypothetical protein ACPGJV_02380 [Bacteriovoracaceae bacterium]
MELLSNYNKDTSFKFEKLKNVFLLICVLFFSVSCLAPSTSSTSNSIDSNDDSIDGGGGTGGSSPSPTPPSSPIVDGEQIQFVTSTGAKSTLFEIDQTSNAQIYLKGQQVNNYLQSFPSSVQCLVLEYPSNTEKAFLVLALLPRNEINFQQNTVERSFVFTTNDPLNQVFCQKSGIINQLAINNPSYDVAYRTEDVCPSCIQSQISNSKVDVYDISGVRNSSLSTSHLTLRLLNTFSSVPTVGGQCTQNSECATLGFQCCSLDKICVYDLDEKSGIDKTSAEWLNAYALTKDNPALRRQFPQFYHVCQSDPGTDVPDVVDDTKQTEDADYNRMVRKKDLYDCTTTTDNELAYCTVEYPNASSDNTTVYETGADDRNFTSVYSGTAQIQNHSIYEVSYGGRTLFKDGVYFSQDVKIGPNNNLLGNDNLSDKGIVELPTPTLTNSPNQTVRVKYQIDGSCEFVNDFVAKCSKYYVQGQNNQSIDDHFPASNVFKIPLYADLNKSITVTVEDAPRFQGTHWNLNATNPPNITFVGSTLQVYDAQKVKIDYFVDLNNDNVLQEKKVALEEIASMCGCKELNCKLTPKFEEQNGQSVIVDYTCLYPDTSDPAPLQQTILLSSKTVPVRFFDENGVSDSDPDYYSKTQEGAEFLYTNNDPLRPNNVDSYIGFNEVYGSLRGDPLGAKPAKEVRVDKGKVYDIFVESGSYSSCLNCGTDYYATIAKIFPQNFVHLGGGYEPVLGLTERKKATPYRSDDLLFGRACFLPVSMIAWSHRSDPNRQSQRLDRMGAQHFQFANGYQRDWYGFDYGSIIGSFDGVKWFSIGNQRRITSETNKLFIAVNSYFGDLTIESTYKVVVSEASTRPFSGSQVDNDLESDGAECQRYHLCETDSDCASNLGWDYTCQEIGGLKTDWPEFDSFANEIPDRTLNASLRSLFKQVQGGTKRCVYRGRGALCHGGLDSATANSTYHGETRTGLLSCSGNHYCQELYTGSASQKFNNKIARFAKSPRSQNLSSVVSESDLDTFGLSARIIGRPYSYFGGDSATPNVLSNLSSNKAQALCIPGRNPASATVLSSLTNTISNTQVGDTMNNLGMTTTEVSSTNPSYFSSCSVIDPDTKNYFFFDSNNITTALTDSRLSRISSNQSLSTNHLAKYEAVLQEDITVQVGGNDPIQSLLFGKNRCLKAPGATCFTDTECAPNNDIAKFVKRSPLNLTGIINNYETQFWSEELICSQADSPEDTDYDPSFNKCCRETSKTITIPTFKPSLMGTSDEFDNRSVPGVGISLDSETRYSRNAVVTDVVEDPLNELFGVTLSSTSADVCTGAGLAGCTDPSDLQKQWKTFHLHAQRTCCSGNWVRNFASENAGGGHTWSNVTNKIQRVKKENFTCYNWANELDGSFTDYTCAPDANGRPSDPDDPECEVRALAEDDYYPIINILGNLELAGIPQIRVPAADKGNYAGLACVSPTNVGAGLPPNFMPNVYNNVSSNAEFGESYNDGTGARDLLYYSNEDMNNYNPEFKKIFDPEKVTCCLPIGDVPQGTDASACCTGFIAQNGNSPRCALDDYSNLSVYFNRFVSSEAQGLDDSLFDDETGFIVDKNRPVGPNGEVYPDVDKVMELACEVNACASGVVITGMSVVPLRVPGFEGNNKIYPRFIDSNSNATPDEDTVAQYWDAGMRWNHHVYCAPPDMEADDRYYKVRRCNEDN